MNDTFELDMEKTRNRLRRGWIVRILDYYRNKQSREVNDRVILAGLGANGHQVTLPTLIADLQYLEEEGYIVLQQQEVAGVKLSTAYLTSKGVRLHEKYITDDAVGFED